VVLTVISVITGHLEMKSRAPCKSSSRKRDPNPHSQGREQNLLRKKRGRKEGDRMREKISTMRNHLKREGKTRISMRRGGTVILMTGRSTADMAKRSRGVVMILILIDFNQNVYTESVTLLNMHTCTKI
jgi:hypothetical protein